jgi:hypothetical protein
MRSQVADEARVSKVVGAGDVGLQGIIENMGHAARGLEKVYDWGALVDQAPSIISTCVDDITRELSSQNVWDVITLLQRFMSPGDLSFRKESENVHSPATIEIVALIAACDGMQSQSAQSSDDTQVAVERIYRSASQIVHLAHMLALASSDNTSLGKAAELTSILRSHEVSVRGRNYISTSRLIASELFDPASIESLIEGVTGYTNRDVVKIWDGIQDFLTGRQTTQFNRMQEIAAEWAAGKEQSAEVEEEGRGIARMLFQQPSLAATFRAEDISELTGLSFETITAVLNTFSIHFLSMTPVEACTKFVHGNNLTAGKGMLRDANGNYLILGDPIPHDYLRPTIEAALKASVRKWEQYQRHRDTWAEKTSAQLVAKLFDQKQATYTSLKYRAPIEGRLSDLARDSLDPKAGTLDTEADALLIIDDVAVCVEVKAGAITDKARSGNVRRVEKDVEKTIGEAAGQADRLRKLIQAYGGLWKTNGKWLDLSQVKEIHTVVVCLDDWGPLAIATDSLVRSGFITSDTIPWVVSLHDLHIIEELFDMPADFLTYLRRRTDPKSARLFIAGDELDLVMWHLNGSFYFEPDPDAIHADNPISSVPTAKDRKRFLANNVPTHVGTLTDPLDAWVYFREGQSSVAADKPKRNNLPVVHSILRFLQDGHKPGWLRFGADLAGLSGVGQRSLGRNFHEVVKLTKGDGRFHSFAQNHVDQWGHGLFLIGSKPSSESIERCRDHLKSYVLLKKYQLRADRALSVLVDQSGELLEVGYNTGSYEQSDELDRLVIEKGLRPPERTGKSIPPSARRSTVRLNTKGKGKR